MHDRIGRVDAVAIGADAHLSGGEGDPVALAHHRRAVVPRHLPRQRTARRYQGGEAAVRRQLDACRRAAAERRQQAVMQRLRQRPAPLVELGITADQIALKELQIRDLDRRRARGDRLRRAAEDLEVEVLLLVVAAGDVAADDQRQVARDEEGAQARDRRVVAELLAQQRRLDARQWVAVTRRPRPGAHFDGIELPQRAAVAELPIRLVVPVGDRLADAVRNETRTRCPVGRPGHQPDEMEVVARRQQPVVGAIAIGRDRLHGQQGAVGQRQRIAEVAGMAGWGRLAVADDVVAERRGDVVDLEVVGVQILGCVEADDPARRVGPELRRGGGVEVAGA